MLSEETIDRLVQPLVDRQEAINQYVIGLIVKRIKEIGKLKPSDIHRLERLIQMGADVRKINAYIAEQTNLQIVDIKKLIRTVALDSYLMAKPLYDYRHKAFIPFDDNYPLQNIVTSIQNRTIETYKNISNSSAFMIRDLKHPRRLMPTEIAETFQSVVDEAVTMVSSGVTDLNSAMRRTMKQLNESGIRYVNYRPESGGLYTQRLDSAVRRNILDGVTAVSQGVQDAIGKQVNADGKEISVHLLCAPDHLPIQGHQFSNEEYEKLQLSRRFKDADGKSFAPIERHIGQYNCRHFTWSIILGITKPNYNKAQLKEINEKNEAGYTLPNGTHLTLYECSQKMRQIETNIRKAKDGQMMALQLGDMELAKEYQAKESRISKEYKAFCKACELKPDMTRTSVVGYKRISIK